MNPGYEVAQGPGSPTDALPIGKPCEEDAGCRRVIAIVSSLEEARAFLGTVAWIADRTLHLLATVRMLRREPDAAAVRMDLLLRATWSTIVQRRRSKAECRCVTRDLESQQAADVALRRRIWLSIYQSVTPDRIKLYHS
jgi:hypothetical protein